MAKPLTKHYINGDLYQRPPHIENLISNLQNENPENLIRRTNIRETSSPEYVPSECIVNLIREARRKDDELALTALLPILLRRCESNLLSKISNDLPRAEEIREEILGQFSEMFAVDGIDDQNNELDFFEVHFNEAFMTLRIDILRKERTKEKVRGQSYIPTFSDDADSASDDEFFERLSKEFHAPASQEHDLILRRIKKAIDGLPEEERRAVVLCHILGYEQASEDPKKRTAATICGVTGKTIHNRLRRAAARLSQLKELIR